MIFFAVEDNYQLGIYGYTPNANTIHIYIDTAYDNFSVEILESSLLHEFHHAVRWANPGYGKKLGEEIVTEGLATLFEEETMGIAPPYAQVKLKKEQVKEANQKINLENTDHYEWFYGTKRIDNWFGYAYGYRLCKNYSEKVNKKASDLVNVSARQVLEINKIILT